MTLYVRKRRRFLPLMVDMFLRLSTRKQKIITKDTNRRCRLDKTEGAFILQAPSCYKHLGILTAIFSNRVNALWVRLQISLGLNIIRAVLS